MSGKVDLSEYKGNYLLERYAFENSPDSTWSALAEAFGWLHPDDPKWMAPERRVLFWSVVLSRRRVSIMARIIDKITRLIALRRA